MAKSFDAAHVVAQYDQHILRLIPAYQLMHWQVQAILAQRMPAKMQVLIVGCGTGYELDYLLTHYPQAAFTAIDPSAQMLQAAKKRLTDDQLGRVEFVQGQMQDLSFCMQYDVALVLLVAHFVPHADKHKFFSAIYQALNVEGLLISYDMMQGNHEMHDDLQALCQYQGLSEKQSQRMREGLEHDFATLSATQYVNLLQEIGFEELTRYLQVFNFGGWHARKRALAHV